jgi:hypothetical protein
LWAPVGVGGEDGRRGQPVWRRPSTQIDACGPRPAIGVAQVSGASVWAGDVGMQASGGGRVGGGDDGMQAGAGASWRAAVAGAVQA